MSDFKKQYLPMAVAAAQKYGLDPVMFVAQIEQESGWNPKAKSSAGAVGLAQIMPETTKDLNISRQDRLDPAISLDAGARYMAQLRKQFGSEELARQAYNAGPGRLRQVLAGKVPMPEETARYNDLITKRAAKLQQEVLAIAPAAAPAAVAQRATIPEAGVAAPMPAAGEPGGRLVSQQEPSKEDAVQIALAQMAAGMPAPQVQQPAEPDWRASLQALSAPPTLLAGATPSVDLDMFGQEIESAVAKAQDTTLAQMFGDILPAQREDTSILPASVDRYLDKILA